MSNELNTEKDTIEVDEVSETQNTEVEAEPTESEEVKSSEDEETSDTEDETKDVVGLDNTPDDFAVSSTPVIDDPQEEMTEEVETELAEKAQAVRSVIVTTPINIYRCPNTDMLLTKYTGAIKILEMNETANGFVPVQFMVPGVGFRHGFIKSL